VEVALRLGLRAIDARDDLEDILDIVLEADDQQRVRVRVDLILSSGCCPWSVPPLAPTAVVVPGFRFSTRSSRICAASSAEMFWIGMISKTGFGSSGGVSISFRRFEIE